MTIALVVDSEEQLDHGAAWCEKLVRLGALSIHLIIVGAERKTLAEQARRRVAEKLDSIPIHVHYVAHDSEAILAAVEAAKASTLLLIHRPNDDGLLVELFEGSSTATLWTNGLPRPRKAGGRVWAALRNHDVTTAASEQILKVTPTAILHDEEPTHGDRLKSGITTSIETVDLDNNDLVVSGADDFGGQDLGYRAGRVLLDHDLKATIVLLHGGHSYVESWANRIYRAATRIAPPMEREARREFARDLELGSQPNFEFFGLMSASAMLAAFGLLQDSAAVIIGAMLIAPLMTPIIGAGLALTQGNRPLFQTAVRTILLGFFGALVTSVLFGWLVLLFQQPVITTEMWARCRPSPLDFCVGLVGGTAASYARTRSHLSSALAGAAIAAALVPPISTAGLQIAFGAWNIEDPPGIPIGGPLLLVGINVLTIMIGSSWVLWARGLRTDPTAALRDRWALRTVTLLSLLALLILIWTITPSISPG